MDQLRPLTLDSSVFISQIQRNETYSHECGALLSRVGSGFFLIEPAIVLTMVGNAVGRNVDMEYGFLLFSKEQRWSRNR
ncbi:MAG: hypothetical protein ABIJ47_07945 [Candidatus Bathyarchaeota archaeon]